MIRNGPFGSTPPPLPALAARAPIESRKPDASSTKPSRTKAYTANEVSRTQQ